MNRYPNIVSLSPQWIESLSVVQAQVASGRWVPARPIGYPSWCIACVQHGSFSLAEQMRSCGRSNEMTLVERLKEMGLAGQEIGHEAADALQFALYALEMVRDANQDEPHIPDVARTTINTAIRMIDPSADILLWSPFDGLVTGPILRRLREVQRIAQDNPYPIQDGVSGTAARGKDEF